MKKDKSSLPVFLILGKHWPEPNSSAAGTRMMQLIRPLLGKWQVIFATAAAPSENAEHLESLGVKQYQVKLNHDSFDEFVAALNPEFVLFDRFMTEEQFGWRVRQHAPNAIRVLDTEDLHGLRAARESAVRAQRSVSDLDLLNEIALREMAAIYRCDLSLIISRYEMELLQGHYNVPEYLLKYLPLMTKHDGAEQPMVGFDQRKDFVTVGNFHHAPNMDAVEQLHKNIWPKIRKHLPDARLRVYGAYPSNKVKELHDPKSGFLVEGRAESVDEIMQSARVCLAPLRFGAGLKGKLFSAMENWTPSVTTQVGAEGIGSTEAWPGMVADDFEAFTYAAVELHEDKVLWEKASQKIHPLLSSFHPDFWSPQWLEMLKELRSHITSVRVKNSTGAVIWHHSLRSTEYFARWIAAKNQLGNPVD